MLATVLINIEMGRQVLSVTLTFLSLHVRQQSPLPAGARLCFGRDEGAGDERDGEGVRGAPDALESSIRPSVTFATSPRVA